jgi:hypothetical protein
MNSKSLKDLLIEIKTNNNMWFIGEKMWNRKDNLEIINCYKKNSIIAKYKAGIVFLEDISLLDENYFKDFIVMYFFNNEKQYKLLKKEDLDNNEFYFHISEISSSNIIIKKYCKLDKGKYNFADTLGLTEINGNDAFSRILVLEDNNRNWRYYHD